MKYMLLIHQSPAIREAVSTQEQEKMAKDHAALVKDLRDAGDYVDGGALAHPSQSRTVRVRDKAAMREEAYLRSVEHIAGFVIVDCDSRDRVEEIAAQLPAARLHDIEIRPIMHHKGMEM